MPYKSSTTGSQKVLAKLVAVTPYQVYLNQVKSAIEPIRYAQLGMDYLPPQFGGLTGQRDTISEVVVLQLTDFEIS
jgi:hypothetical protein